MTGNEAEALDHLMAGRYSCRAFRPDPVPQPVIEAILRSAGRAASWNNTQPWKLVITRGDATDRFREALLREAARGGPEPDLPWPESYPGILGERRRSCGYALYAAAGIARDDRPARAAQAMRNFALFDAPHVAIVHISAVLGAYGALDAGGFITAFMLAARAQGVDTIAQAAVAAYPALIRSHFGIGADRVVLCAVSFGYADESDPVNGYRTERAEPAAFTEFLDG